MVETVEVLVEGGQATAGPPIGPALGPLGINILQVVEAVNQRTKDFEGMKVPVKILVDPVQGTFDLEVGTPTTSALLLKAAGVAKGSGWPLTDKVADLSLDRILKVARMKDESLLGADLKRKALEVLGTCVTMGVTVEGKDPRAVQDEVKQGLHEAVFEA